MKKIALLLLFIPIIGFSQDCKFEKNEIDPFSKTKVVHSKMRAIVDVLGRSVYFQFQFNKIPYINVEFSFGAYAKDAVLIPENKVLFLLNNDDVINFTVGENIQPKASPFMNNYLYKFNIKFETSIADVEKIKTIGIKSIRLETKEKEYDFNVSNKKDIAKMNTIIECFLNEVSK